VLYTFSFSVFSNGVSAQQTQVTGQMQALAAAQYRTETQVATLTEIVQRISVDVGRLTGDGLEVRYTLRGIPSLTRLVRRPQPLSQAELDTLLEDAETPGLLSEAESQDISQADLVIRGRRRGAGRDVYVVTAISWGVGIDDVQRAARRAALLAKAGRHAIPAVAGEWVTPEAQRLAPTWGCGNSRRRQPCHRHPDDVRAGNVPTTFSLSVFSTSVSAVLAGVLTARCFLGVRSR
jgi:hypothetical protein